LLLASFANASKEDLARISLLFVDAIASGCGLHA
jgi:hypothetical protein